MVQEGCVERCKLDSHSDPALEGLNRDLVRVEEEIESDFANMPPSEAAHSATARLREYETKLQKASFSFIRSRMGVEPRHLDR